MLVVHTQAYSKTMADEDHYSGVMLEDINHKLAAIMEGQKAMAGVPSAITRLEDDMTDVKTRLATMQAAMKDEGKEQRTKIDNHEGRLTMLEKSVA